MKIKLKSQTPTKKPPHDSLSTMGWKFQNFHRKTYFRSCIKFFHESQNIQETVKLLREINEPEWIIGKIYTHCLARYSWDWRCARDFTTISSHAQFPSTIFKYEYIIWRFILIVQIHLGLEMYVCLRFHSRPHTITLQQFLLTRNHESQSFWHNSIMHKPE